MTLKGLVDPKLGEDEIAQMRFGIPGLIAQEVMRLSGLTEEAGEADAMRKFRGEP